MVVFDDALRESARSVLNTAALALPQRLLGLFHSLKQARHFPMAFARCGFHNLCVRQSHGIAFRAV